MVRTIALALSTVAALGVTQRGPASEVALKDLTVPAERLPEGCALSQSASGTGLRTPTNPWTGTDAPTIASIRERIEGAVVLPDPPALTTRELAAFRLHLAEGVEEAYAAVYKQPESTLILVYGMKLAGAEHAIDPRRGDRTSGNPGIIRVTIGSIVAIVNGDGGACFRAVGAHVKSLVN